MARTCERPGCSQVAEVAYGFQAEPYVIWLDRPDAPDGDRRRAGVLCRRHADAMVVPIGWSLDDRRDPAPRLFPSPPPPGASPAPSDDTGSTRRRSRQAAAGVETVPAARGWTEVSLFDVAAYSDVPNAVPVDDAVEEPSEEPSPDLAEQPAEEPAAPWKPVFDPADDLDGLLAPTSPLLSRAFRGERPRTEGA